MIVQQIGPGMVQQIQTVCPDCKGQGERINPRDRCTTCNGNKVVREKKILEIHIDKGKELKFFYLFFFSLYANFPTESGVPIGHFCSIWPSIPFIIPPSCPVSVTVCLCFLGLVVFMTCFCNTCLNCWLLLGGQKGGGCTFCK